MITKILICVTSLVLTLSLISCQCRKDASLCLLEADSLMEKRPDSALFILRNMGFPEKLPAEEYATWCLLLTQAMDKNYEEHTSDSLIAIAVNYFSKQQDPKKKAKAFYYHGRVNQDLGLPDLALSNYLSALDFAQMTDDYKLCGLICDYTAQIYGEQFMNDGIIPRFRQACQYYVQACDTLGQIYALLNVGRIYADIEPYCIDSALFYYKQAFTLAERIEHTTAQSSILNDIGSVYKKQGDFSSAEESIVRAIHLSSQKNNFLLPKYSNLGDLYLKMGVYDSARHYLKASLESPDLSIRGSSYLRLSKLEESLGNYKQACEYKDQYVLYEDSLNKQLFGAELKSVERKYHAEKSIQELKEKTLVQKTYYLLVVSIILVFFFLVVFWYQRRQRRKDQEIYQQEQEIRQFRELADQHKSQIESYSMEINSLKKRNETLLLSNLDSEKNKCAIQENEKVIENLEFRIAEAEKILTSTNFLKDKIKELQLLLLNQSPIYRAIEPYIGQMHRNRKDNGLSFSTIEWQNFLAIFNNVHNDLLTNLKKEYKLEHDDLVLFSLMKLSIIGGNIQIILNLNSPSLITRKKTRLAAHLNIKLSEVDKFVKHRNV